MDEQSEAPVATHESDQQLVDRITYLASLASEAMVIDPLLDTLRSVTARWQPGMSLSAEDRLKLTQLEEELKTYLVNNDPLRSFTPETLNARLQNKGPSGIVSVVGPMSMVTVVLTALLTGLLVFVFTPAVDLAAKQRFFLAIPFFFLVLHLGIAWFYWSAFKNFKAEFRRAFAYICVGILLFTVYYSHYALVGLFDLERYALFQYGGLTGLITLSFIWMYAGLRRYARILHLKTHLTSLPLVVGLSLLVIAGAIVAPHGGQPEEFYFDLSLASIWMFAFIEALCLALAVKLTKNLTPAYARPMRFLGMYFVLGLLSSLGSSIILPITGELKGELLLTLSVVLGIGPQLFLLYTGYVFKKETSR